MKNLILLFTVVAMGTIVSAGSIFQSHQNTGELFPMHAIIARCS